MNGYPHSIVVTLQYTGTEYKVTSDGDKKNVCSIERSCPFKSGGTTLIE